MEQPLLTQILERVRRGELDVADAAAQLAAAPAVDLGFATIDRERPWRCGFPEVIFGPGKTPEQVTAIAARIATTGHGCLATRLDDAQVRALQERFPTGEHDPVGRTFWQPPEGFASRTPTGCVGVVTAGTTDLPVAREACATARAMGCQAELVVDVGVAGLHRLLNHRTWLARQDSLVVVAGMEGTLPSVVGGLVACPVIAVPTSVGYGASFSGVTALLAMLCSCAANVAVVNIDSGFCGGYVAALIARQSAAAKSGDTRSRDATNLAE